jgi:hypothetical protein
VAVFGVLFQHGLDRVLVTAAAAGGVGALLARVFVPETAAQAQR